MTQTHKIDDTIYLVGEKTISTSPFVPYSSILCEFLNDLSAALRSSSEAAEYPDILAFAFWCRRGNIKKLRASFVGDEARLGRGLVFILLPLMSLLILHIPLFLGFSLETQTLLEYLQNNLYRLILW